MVFIFVFGMHKTREPFTAYVQIKQSLLAIT
jgi:hypothetical protein